MISLVSFGILQLVVRQLLCEVDVCRCDSFSQHLHKTLAVSAGVDGRDKVYTCLAKIDINCDVNGCACKKSSASPTASMGDKHWKFAGPLRIWSHCRFFADSERATGPRVSEKR